MNIFIKLTLLGLIFFITSIGCTKEPEYFYKEKKVIRSPFIWEGIKLDEEFDLFITSGSSVHLGLRPNNLLISLDKMVIMCVSLKKDDDKCIGDQFFFHFKASQKDKKTWKTKRFVLSMTEPQNMSFLDTDVKENLEKTLFGYKVTLLDFNFTISKNSIRMIISKEFE